jgi:integrase
MAETSSQTASARVPVFQGKQRVAGLFSYCKADGRTISYCWSKRVEGRMTRGVLKTAGTVAQPRKTEAIREFEHLFADVERGTAVIGNRSLTVRALVEDFLARERGQLGKLSAGTVNLYEIRLEQHVLPTIGTMKVADVKVQHVRRLLDDWKRQEQSGAGMRVTAAALSAAYRHGIVRLGLATNPLRGLERGELPSGKRQTEPRYLAVAEVERLFAELSDETRPVAATCFYAEARVSEALALAWSDIDFEAKTIHIPGTKTEESDATVRLLEPLAVELKAHRARQAKLGFERVKPDAPVFKKRTGRSPGRRDLLTAVNNASVRAGLVKDGEEKVGLHDLGHSLANYAWPRLSPVEVSKLLRDGNTQVTLTAYAGLDESAVLAAGDKLAAGLGS